MSEKPLHDPFLNFVERASRQIQRTISGLVRWLLAAILSSGIGTWFWSPVWTGFFRQTSEGKWVRDGRWGNYMPGGEGIVFGGAVVIFALWAWIQVCRAGWSFLRKSKKPQAAKFHQRGS